MRLSLKHILFFLPLWFAACTNSNPKVDELPANPTFADHIAPIIHSNCTPCHRDDNIAPFKLITYKEVRNRASLIKAVTQTRYMPPWPADPTYSHFIGEKVLTDNEIKTIGFWVDQGMQPGDTTKVKPPTNFANPFTNRKPDLVIAMDKPYVIKGNNTDNFMVMKLPYKMAKDTFVQYIEYVPGNRKVIHHVNTHLLSYEPGKKNTAHDKTMLADQQTGMAAEIHKRIGLLNDDGSYPLMTPSVSNYLPGTEPYMYPNGIGGYRFKATGALYLNDMHYGPTPIDASDSSYFNIYFSKTPPERPTGEFIIGTLSTGKRAEVTPQLIVPPNTVKEFKAELVIEKDISLLTVIPHMHLIGKSFKAYALTPNGDTIKLVRINNWDFRWQYFYTFKKMVKIPAGSRIVAEGVYDNTIQNPNNPNNPPKEIRERDGSMRTTDEMFQLICVYVNYKPGDEDIPLE
ncbi:MAG: hypothetical protein M0D57_15920 [Sphingobacteriales bacterium JAD_PAG50586_3]|nr:MAG: hypothetical protein M0D57_15920 [Sphingobacteriales bacterium JAD_PAG50586_3]